MAIALTISLFIVLLVATSVLSYVLSQQAFRRNLNELEGRTAHQFGTLFESVESLKGEVARLRTQNSTQSAANASPPPSAAEPATEEKREKKASEVTPEILVMITAAITAFLGKKVRIRSARFLEPSYEIVNPWAHLGRVIVQASHDLSLRS